MDDVELVFANAITYNEEYSQVWEDAKFLLVCRFTPVPESP